MSKVNDLLALKQQQAGVMQAWQSVKQSEETLRQGRAIMMFTVVTIVFVSRFRYPAISDVHGTELRLASLVVCFWSFRHEQRGLWYQLDIS
jgi:hypothetical protein